MSRILCTPVIKTCSNNNHGDPPLIFGNRDHMADYFLFLVLFIVLSCQLQCKQQN